MSLYRLAAIAALAVPLCAQPPLPDLKTEATDAGSVFHVRNVASQPLTGYLIELVDYPGSSYALWQDEAAGQPVPPGGEKIIPITNMTVGAAPEYVKLRAAIYADGTSSGIAAKVEQFIARRRAVLATTRELVSRLEKAKSAGADKAAVTGGLKQWAGSIPAPTRATRNSQEAINNAAARTLILETAAQLDSDAPEEVLMRLRATERALASSRPAL